MAVLSPCINVCRMDEANRLCTGCLRTIDEIAAWSRCSDEAKHDILRRIEQRRSERTVQPTGTPEARQ